MNHLDDRLSAKKIDATEILDRLKPGMTVYCAGGMSHPSALVAAINQAPEKTHGVRFLVTRAPGFGEPWLRAPKGRIVTFFGDRALEGRSEVEVVPMQYRRIYDYLASEPIDLALVQLADPRRNEEAREDTEAGVARGVNGVAECSNGLGVDFLPALLEDSAERHPCAIVAELNAALPSPPGVGSVSLDRLDAIVPTNRPPEILARSTDASGGEIGRRIGEHVASLIEDGDCLQTGVGAIPDAVLAALSDRRHLGFHSGMASDGVLDLVLSGALTGACKTRDPGKIVVGFVHGSERLYQWAAESNDLLMRPVSYTHDSAIVASLDRFVAINSAIEVDLFGQVNAERVRGRQVSGTGGSIDFCRGAARSRGGRSIVALPSTAARGKVSRIVPRLKGGAVATLTRTDVDFVVTEHGVAKLRGRGEQARAEALIGIADPSSRAELRSAWAASRRLRREAR